MEVRKAKGRKISFGGEPGDLFVTLVLDARAAIRELSGSCPLLGQEASNDPEILDLLGEAVRQRAQASMEAARKMQVDFLGIGRALKEQHPHWWHQIARGRNHVPELVNLPVHIYVTPAIAEYGRQRW